MSDPVSFFLIEYPNKDILLAAADYYGVARDEDFKLSGAPGSDEQILIARGREHRVCSLETEGSAAFLKAGSQGSYSAFLLNRSFELCTYNLDDFRLFPPGLRKALKNQGLVALRFSPEGRIQLVLTPQEGSIESLYR